MFVRPDAVSGSMGNECVGRCRKKLEDNIPSRERLSWFVTQGGKSIPQIIVARA
jgi:hypothetical protein